MTALLEDASRETLDAIKKAQTTGITTSTGLVSYDLTGLVRLIPVVTPLRDMIPREQATDGAKFAVWRALMNVNNSQPRATPGFDVAGNEVIFSEQDFQALYKPLALAGLVTQDSYDIAKGIADAYAETTFGVLNQVLIAEDKILFGGQSFALAQPAVPTTTPSTTGGSLPANTTQKIAVAARTGSGYFYGGNSQGRASAAVTTTGSTSSIVASVPAVKGAVAYDWFYASDGATYHYYGTTTVASVTVTVAISADNPVPTNNVNLPDLASAAPSLNLAADNGSGQAAEQDGLLATLTADYSTTGLWVPSGTGTTNPAAFIDGGGAALALSGGQITQIESLFLAVWAAIKDSPSAIMLNALQAQEIANLVLGSNSAVTYLQTDETGRVNATAGGRVGSIINTPAGGKVVPIEVHPSVPPGTIIARSDRVPFPQAEITNTLAVRTLRDMTQFEYAANRATGANGGPRQEFEIRSMEAFVNRAPVSMGVLSNIG